MYKSIEDVQSVKINALPALFHNSNNITVIYKHIK